MTAPRRALASAALLAAAAAPVSAQIETAIGAALDRFVTACGMALADPDAYVASLVIPGPAGEAVTYPAPDGRYLLVHTAQSEGITEFVEFATLPDRSERRCEVSAVLPDYPEGAEIDAALRPMLDAAGTARVGGAVEMSVPMWEPGDAAAVFPVDTWYVYRMTGLLPDLDVVAGAHVELGGVTFHADRIVPSEDAQ